MDNLEFDTMDDFGAAGAASSGAGFGLELLMNTKAKENTSKYFSNNTLDDVTQLDQTLNDMNYGGGGADMYKPQSSLFSATDGEVPDLRFDTATDPMGNDSTPLHVNFDEKPIFEGDPMAST